MSGHCVFSKKHSFKLTVFCLVGLILIFPANNRVNAQNPVIHSVLFYSPACPHCHEVITQDLLPLVEKYGGQLVILAIDTTTEKGSELFVSTLTHLQIPTNQLFVPTLVEGDYVLVGSSEISEEFPAIIENGLMEGGIGWLDVPSMIDYLRSEEMFKEPDDSEGELSTEDVNLSADITVSDISNEKVPTGREQISTVPTLGELAINNNEERTMVRQFKKDLMGNLIAVLILLGMLGVVIRTSAVFLTSTRRMQPWSKWITLLLVIIGLGVALYLAFVETTQAEVVCGPVGDCNTVQQSTYAYLFGFIPVGILGSIGYFLIGILWWVINFGPHKWVRLCSLTLLGLTISGTLFSIYLTFLEPFVIGATCIWCLISAVIMTMLMWNSAQVVDHTGMSNRKKSTT